MFASRVFRVLRGQFLCRFRFELPTDQLRRTGVMYAPESSGDRVKYMDKVAVAPHALDAVCLMNSNERNRRN